MISTNWDTFKYKFSENRQKNFEWLCYLLFCRKYGREEGIFSYFNQSAIETEPIEHQQQIIGWQAKFYDTTLSQRERELTETVKKVHENYPKLTKLVIYTNSKWAQTKGQKPKGQIRIEQLAASFSIEIEWNTKSFFESEFVCLKNADISSFFFENDSILERIHKNIDLHNKRILDNIKNEISYGNEKYRIDRQEQINLIENSNESIIVISGDAGCGKSAIVKEFLSSKKTPFVIIKAQELEKPSYHLEELFQKLEQYIRLFSTEQRKYFVIDSAEKIWELDNRVYASASLKMLIHNNWKIILTTRERFCDSVIRFFITKGYPCKVQNVRVGEISDDELFRILSIFRKAAPTNLKLHELIKIPFYLNQYISLNHDTDLNSFKNDIWHRVLENYDQVFTEIIVSNLKKGNIYLESLSQDIKKFLLEKDVIAQDEIGCYIAQDIYEDLALEKYISQKFANQGFSSNFFDAFDCKYSFVKAYRKWLLEKIEHDSLSVDQILESVDITSRNMVAEETLTAILMSNHSEVIFQNYSDLLLQKDSSLLKKITNILKVMCKTLDFEKANLFGIQVKSENIESYWTKPIGSGWISFFIFIDKNLNQLSEAEINLALPLMRDWTSSFNSGETTKIVGDIAAKIYKGLLEKNDFLYRNDNILFEILCNGSAENQNEIYDILSRIINSDDEHLNHIEEKLLHYILESPAPGTLCKTHSLEILKLAGKYWRSHQENEYESFEVEQYYGISDRWDHSYSAVSAMQSPILLLLFSNFEATLDWIINFVNESAEKYHQSSFGKESKKIGLIIKGKTNIQIADLELWNFYRGNWGKTKPGILVCIHMALEYFLLKKSEEANSQDLQNTLFLILEKSKSISLTSIVGSIVLAYPEKFFEVAFELFKNKDCLSFDSMRANMENIPYSSRYADKRHFPLAFNERQKAESLPFRKNSLANLCLLYQAGLFQSVSENDKNKLQALIDSYYSENDSNDQWHAILQKMDVRKNKIFLQKQNDGLVAVNSLTAFDEQSQKYTRKTEENLQNQVAHFKLHDWATKRWTANSATSTENFPPDICKEMQEMVDDIEAQSKDRYSIYHYHDTLTLAACCLIRDSWDQLPEENKDLCRKIIYIYSIQPFTLDYNYQCGDGTDNSILALGLLCHFDFKNEIWMHILTYSLFRYGEQHNIFKKNAIQSLEILNSFDEKKALQVVECFLYLLPIWNTFLHQRNVKIPSNKGFYEHFFETHESVIEDFLTNGINLSTNWNWDYYTLDDFEEAFYVAGSVQLDQMLIKFAIEKSFRLLQKDKRNREYQYSSALASFTLNLSADNVVDILKPIIVGYDGSQFYQQFFENLILEEELQPRPKTFWAIWKAFEQPIILKNSSYQKYILSCYMFGKVYNRESWNYAFGNECIDKMILTFSQECEQGDYLIRPMSSLLYRLIPERIPQNIRHLKKCIEKSSRKYIDDETIYIVEMVVKIYVHNFQKDFQKNKPKKDILLYILDFLIEYGSMTAHFIKEDLI